MRSFHASALQPSAAAAEPEPVPHASWEEAAELTSDQLTPRQARWVLMYCAYNLVARLVNCLGTTAAARPRPDIGSLSLGFPMLLWGQSASNRAPTPPHPTHPHMHNCTRPSLPHPLQPCLYARRRWLRCWTDTLWGRGPPRRLWPMRCATAGGATRSPARCGCDSGPPALPGAIVCGPAWAPGSLACASRPPPACLLRCCVYTAPPPAALHALLRATSCSTLPQPPTPPTHTQPNHPATQTGGDPPQEPAHDWPHRLRQD